MHPRGSNFTNLQLSFLNLVNSSTVCYVYFSREKLLKIDINKIETEKNRVAYPGFVAPAVDCGDDDGDCCCCCCWDVVD